MAGGRMLPAEFTFPEDACPIHTFENFRYNKYLASQPFN